MGAPGLTTVLERQSTLWNASYSLAVVGTMFNTPNLEVTAVAGANDYSQPETSRMTPDTVIPMGSCTKTTSAVIALRLAEQGIISMDEPVMPYVNRYLARQLDCAGLPADSYCSTTCIPQAAFLNGCIQGSTDNNCKVLGSRCLAECDGYHHCNTGVHDPTNPNAPFTPTMNALPATIRLAQMPSAKSLPVPAQRLR